MPTIETMDPLSSPQNVEIQQSEVSDSQTIVISDSQNVSPPTLIPEPASNTIPYFLFGSMTVIIVLMTVGMLFMKTPIPRKKLLQQSPTAITANISPTPIPTTTTYTNPFDENSAYQNPFVQSNTYQNPFNGVQ